MGKLVVRGYLATDISVSKYGYYFSLRESVGADKSQFHSVFINEVQRVEMEKANLKKSSYIDVLGNQRLDIFEKAGKPFLSSVLNLIHWEYVSKLKERSTSIDIGSPVTENIGINVTKLNSDVLPY